MQTSVCSPHHGASPPAGLILVNEPYYNEAGFDSDRGLQEGYENSRCYNEMALIKMVQSMTQLLQSPVDVFRQEIQEHFACSGWRLVHRLDVWLELNEAAERGPAPHVSSRPSLSKEPLGEEAAAGVASCILEEELEDSGLSGSTAELSQNSDCDQESRGSSSLRGAAPEAASVTVSGGGAAGGAGGASSAAGAQPVVRPKKRRKSYRSFLPEGSGYPDIGFPLFPLSKGFVKSVRGVLLQYRAALAAAGITEHTEDK